MREVIIFNVVAIKNAMLVTIALGLWSSDGLVRF